MTKENTKYSKVAFVGFPNVGKSTLLNNIVKAKIAPITKKAQTTRKIIKGIVTKDNCQLVLFDTPGIVKKEKGIKSFMYGQIYRALDEVDQVVFIVDATVDFNKYLEFFSHVESKAKKNNISICAVINKVDKLANKDLLLEKIKSLQEEFKVDRIIPISALHDDGTENLLKDLISHASEGEFFFDKEAFTDAPEKEIVEEIIREKCLISLESEVPYELSIVVDTFDESRRDDTEKPLIDISATIYVARESQKAIVLGAKGSKIKSIATKARLDIENLLGAKVMLRVFVKVLKNWTLDNKSLKKLGYA